MHTKITYFSYRSPVPNRFIKYPSWRNIPKYTPRSLISRTDHRSRIVSSNIPREIFPNTHQGSPTLYQSPRRLLFAKHRRDIDNRAESSPRSPSPKNVLSTNTSSSTSVLYLPRGHDISLRAFFPRNFRDPVKLLSRHDVAVRQRDSLSSDNSSVGSRCVGW